MNLTRERAKKWKDNEIIFHPIGVIHSDHTEHDNTPIQGVFYKNNISMGGLNLVDEFFNTRGSAGMLSGPDTLL